MESQTLIEPQRGVESLDVQSDGFSEVSGFPQQVFENRAADARAAAFGHESNIHQPDLRWSIVEINSADGSVIAQDDLKQRIAVMFPVVRGLKLKLRPQERFLLRCIPAGQGHLN